MLNFITKYLHQVKEAWEAENRHIEASMHEERIEYFNNKANKRFNIIQQGNQKYITLDGIKVTNGSQDNGELLELLCCLRKMYVSDQLNVK